MHRTFWLKKPDRLDICISKAITGSNTKKQVLSVNSKSEDCKKSSNICSSSLIIKIASIMKAVKLKTIGVVLIFLVGVAQVCNSVCEGKILIHVIFVSQVHFQSTSIMRVYVRIVKNSIKISYAQLGKRWGNTFKYNLCRTVMLR